MIYAVMIVGQGEADRYLDPVLDRVCRWADRVHVALEPGADDELTIVQKYTNSVSWLRVSKDENESMAKNEAWINMAHELMPTPSDLIAFVKPTEVIQDPAAIRRAAKDYPGMALCVTLYHLWDEDHVRIDDSWEPSTEVVFLPFKRGGSFPDYRLRAGRLPSYHYQHPTHGVPVSDMVDYDMVTFDDKIRKWEWFDRVGAQDFYSIDHINSIRRTPMLRTWKKGGLLNVGQTI